jgi:acetoin utilization deacetylase AcuC-like enzyme
MNSHALDKTAEEPAYILDDHYLLHDPGPRHPESPQRLIAIQQMLESLGEGRFRKLHPRRACFDELMLVHSATHVHRIEHASKLAPTSLDLDTSLSTDSYQTAVLAAGGALRSVDAVCSDNTRRVFAFVRPPGHHASRERASGFCLFNNIALAAAYARRKYKLERVAIVDMDVHHGDGTQSCFYESPAVLYISSHQYPFYPGSGNFNEVGRGEGKGYTLNFPLPENAGDGTFIPLYSKVIPAVLEQYRPELILISAGFDGHFRDPIGGLMLTQAGYASAAASLIQAADTLCSGRICFVLEGGYDLDSLKECSRAVMLEMEKPHPEASPVHESPMFKEVARQAARFAAGLWRW